MQHRVYKLRLLSDMIHSFKRTSSRRLPEDNLMEGRNMLTGNKRFLILQLQRRRVVLYDCTFVSLSAAPNVGTQSSPISETALLFGRSRYSPACPSGESSSRWRWVWSMGRMTPENPSIHSSTYSSATLAPDLTWTNPGSNPGLCGDRPATNRVTHDTVFLNILNTDSVPRSKHTPSRL